MTMRFLRWLVGYVQFEITGGDAQRFLTGASVRGYRLWNMKRVGETCCSACIAVKYYRELHQIAKKRRLRLRIKKRGGIPFLLRKWKRTGKHGLFFGAVGAAVLLCVFSARVWVVNISGNTALPSEEIRAAAAEFGLDVGTGKSGLNPLAVENELMLRFPELSWVTVNTWGSTVEIVVREGDAKPEMEDASAYGNITAAQSGQIMQMDVYHGKALVKPGDGVAKGQLLVSGVQEFETGETSFTKASAKIMAKTRRQFSVTIPKEEIQYRETGNVVTRKSLRIFGISIPLTFTGVPEGDYKKQSERHSIQWNDVDLPLTIYKENYSEQEKYLEKVTRSTAEKRGEEALRSWEAETLADGKILSKEQTISEDETGWILTWNCVCLENIAKEEAFFVELDENSEQIEQ